MEPSPSTRLGYALSLKLPPLSKFGYKLISYMHEANDCTLLYMVVNVYYGCLNDEIEMTTIEPS